MLAMGILKEEHSSSNVANSESIGEAAIILLAIGSVLIILCAASIIYGLHRRRRHISLTTGAGVSSPNEESAPNPTDFMNSLATWDRCHSMDEILEKRRRSVWTLEIFENYGSSDTKSDIKAHSES